MSLPRFAKLDPDRRAAILTAGAREFAAAGFAGASFNRIIAQSGLSKGSVYYYFADKDDLYQTVLEDVGGRVLERMHGPEVVDSPDAYWTAWHASYRRVLAHLAEHPVDAALVWGAIAARARGTGHPALELLAARLFERVGDLLAAGQRAGAVRSDLPEPLLLHAVFGMLEGVDRWFADEWASATPADQDRMADLAIALLQRLAEPQRKGTA